MITCDCCGRTDFDEAFWTSELSFDGKPTGVCYSSCRHCGMSIKQPFPEGLRDYYEKNWQSPERDFTETARWVAESLHVHGTTTFARAVDVGSRGWGFLAALEGEGIDLSAGELSDPHGDPGAWLGTGKVEATKDCGFISALHVLEHVEDIGLFMQDIFGMLEPRGILFLEVPSTELGTTTAENDDIARTHLRHFPLSALAAFMSFHGFQILRLDMADQDGLQSNRVLARKTGVPNGRELLLDVWKMSQARYHLAIEQLSKVTPSKVGLYGFSDAYYKLYIQEPPRVRHFRVFDKHRHGVEFDGIKVEPPGNIDLPELWLTPRQPRVIAAIREDLGETHPSVKLRSIWE